MKYLHLLRLASNSNLLRLARTHPIQAIAILLMALLSTALVLGAIKAPSFAEYMMVLVLVLVCAFILLGVVVLKSGK